MGCDSHFFLEKRTNNGPWQLDPGHEFETREGRDPEPKSIPSLSGRDYFFFGILAGVRYPTKKPIAPRRGLPLDVSPQLHSEYRTEWYHSATHLTVKELENALNKYEKYLSKGTSWLENNVEAPAEDAFKYSEYTQINNSIVKYIRSHLDWEKIENRLLGLKNKTEFRIIVWFDS